MVVLALNAKCASLIPHDPKNLPKIMMIPSTTIDADYFLWRGLVTIFDSHDLAASHQSYRGPLPLSFEHLCVLGFA